MPNYEVGVRFGAVWYKTKPVLIEMMGLVCVGLWVERFPWVSSYSVCLFVSSSVQAERLWRSSVLLRLGLGTRNQPLHKTWVSNVSLSRSLCVNALWFSQIFKVSMLLLVQEVVKRPSLCTVPELNDLENSADTDFMILYTLKKNKRYQ